MRFLHKRAEDVMVLLIAVMFAAFIIQIVSRYVFNARHRLDARGDPDLLAVADLLGRRVLPRRTGSREVRRALQPRRRAGAPDDGADLGGGHGDRLRHIAAGDLGLHLLQGDPRHRSFRHPTGPRFRRLHDLPRRHDHSLRPARLEADPRRQPALSSSGRSCSERVRSSGASSSCSALPASARLSPCR